MHARDIATARRVIGRSPHCRRGPIRFALAGATFSAYLSVLATVAMADPAGATTVQVAPGETLSAIAARYHTTVAAIAAANDITNVDLIYSGRVLQVPSSSSSGSVAVAPGETLTGIAARHGTTVSALAAANDITNFNLVYAGETLSLPGGPPLPAPVGAGNGTVVVGWGDTLSAIAARYGTTISALAATNDLGDPNHVLAGAVLQLPGTSASLPPLLAAHADRLAARPYFVQAANAYNVPLSLLEAVCWWESGWQQSVVSVTGAVGMCQVEPYTAAFVNTHLAPGQNLDLSSTTGNIAIAAVLLNYLLEATGNDQELAVAAYYQGLQSVLRHGLLPTTANYANGILALTSVFASLG